MSAEVRYDADDKEAIEKLANHWHEAFTTIDQGATQTNVALTPAIDGARLSSMSDFWRYYRAVRVVIHFMSITAASTSRSGAMISFCRGIMGTVPSTLLNLSQMDKMAHQFAYQSVPSKLVLKRRDLVGKDAIFKWWQTQGVGDVEIDSQGTLVFGNVSESGDVLVAVTNGVQCIFEVHMEFCGRLPSAVSFERQKKRFELGRGPEKLIVVQDDEKEETMSVTSKEKTAITYVSRPVELKHPRSHGSKVQDAVKVWESAKRQ